MESQVEYEAPKSKSFVELCKQVEVNDLSNVPPANPEEEDQD